MNTLDEDLALLIEFSNTDDESIHSWEEETLETPFENDDSHVQNQIKTRLPSSDTDYNSVSFTTDSSNSRNCSIQDEFDSEKMYCNT